MERLKEQAAIQAAKEALSQCEDGQRSSAECDNKASENIEEVRKMFPAFSLLHRRRMKGNKETSRSERQTNPLLYFLSVMEVKTKNILNPRRADIKDMAWVFAHLNDSSSILLS